MPCASGCGPASGATLAPELHDWSTNASRRGALRALTNGEPESPTRTRADVVFSHNEVNDRHGTGILIQRLFNAHHVDVISVRGVSDWAGDQAFGSQRLVIPAGMTRSEIYRWTLEQLAGTAVRHVYCVPWKSTELHGALAVRDSHRVPFCLYIMDDQNITASGIDDELMAEAVEKATLRLAVSSDMRDAFESKYHRKFWIAPPTIPRGLTPARGHGSGKGRAVIVGNIWSPDWLADLITTIRASALRVDWFCNAPQGGPWLAGPSMNELAPARIKLHESLPAEQLVPRLRDYGAVLVPTAPRDTVDNFAVASLSLPSRVPFLIGATDLPIIVLGHPDTCVARFVEHFNVGIVCEYRADALRRALAISEDAGWRERQQAGLEHLRRVLRADIAEWVEASMRIGSAWNEQFEALDVRPSRYARRYLDDARRLGPWLHGYDGIEAAFRRMAATGYAPDFIIDAGASTGVWSFAVSCVYPRARYVLIEPSLEQYDRASRDKYIGALQTVDIVRCAVGSSEGKGVIASSESPYQGSLASGDGVAQGTGSSVRIRTLDTLASELELAGRGVLKLDLQGGELAALRGATDLLASSIDAVVTEVSVEPAAEQRYYEVDEFLRSVGFALVDDAGEWREPRTGKLLEKDLIYVRHEPASPLRIAQLATS